MNVVFALKNYQMADKFVLIIIVNMDIIVSVLDDGYGQVTRVPYVEHELN